MRHPNREIDHWDLEIRQTMILPIKAIYIEESGARGRKFVLYPVYEKSYPRADRSPPKLPADFQ